MQIDQPVFRSVQQALSFSFLMETLPVSQKSQMSAIYIQGGNNVRGNDSPVVSSITFGGLNPLEVRGQCAMVRAAVQDHLMLSERMAIFARYAYQAQKSSGVRHIRDKSIPLLSCKDEFAALCMAWSIFGTEEQKEGLSTRAIADAYSLSQSMVARDTKEIRRTFKIFLYGAHDKLESLFKNSHLIDE